MEHFFTLIHLVATHPELLVTVMQYSPFIEIGKVWELVDMFIVVFVLGPVMVIVNGGA